MAKKMKARDLREAQKKAQAERFKQKDAERQTEQTAKAEKPEQKKTVEVQEKKTKATNKKSVNKSAGLKSTLVVGEELYLTTFGRGNDAIVEYKIDGGLKPEKVAEESSITVTNVEKRGASFESKRNIRIDRELIADNPRHGKQQNDSRKPIDLLGLKSELEKRFFGKTFDDNLHIQIIYNILDIEKILAVYSTNIVATLDNMVDESVNVEWEEFMGYMSAQNTYGAFIDPDSEPSLAGNEKAKNNIRGSRDKFEKLIKNGRLGYFDIEDSRNLRGKGILDVGNNSQKRMYHLIALAGFLRQWCFHDRSNKLYNLEGQIHKEYKDTLNYYFDNRFTEITDNFSSQNRVNLYILKDIYGEEKWKEVSGLYYDFIVEKNYKNIGFSIKKLREQMLLLEGASFIKDNEYDSIRPKLYKLMDFCIFYYYYCNIGEMDDLVNALRSTLMEEDKEELYKTEAAKLWNKHGKLFTSFCEKNGNYNLEELSKKLGVKNEKAKADFSELSVDVSAFKEKYNDVSLFAKLIYAMCFFLDGKEINDLLTTLISKFSDISSFIATAKELRLDVDFKKSYEFFDNSEKHTREMNLVKNLARMHRADAGSRNALVRDAIYILGMEGNMTQEQLEKKISEFLKAESGNKKGPRDFRNFITNNVIKNRRFITYTIKFCNPKTVRRLCKNKAAVRFVLSRIPPEQLHRYYTSCVEMIDEGASVGQKVNALTTAVTEMNLGSFEEIRTKSAEDGRRKTRNIAVTGLYLTVAYQLIKNLANVNARYVIAIHCLERDTELYSELYGLAEDKKISHTELAKELWDKGENSHNRYLAKNERVRKYTKENIDNLSEMEAEAKAQGKYPVFTNYRNIIAHLTAVRNCTAHINEESGPAKIDSYFALYHYIMQHQMNRIKHRYFDLLDKHNSYVMDMVKALNSPFAYNVPRFKNLSIEGLFDRNELKGENPEQ